MKENSAPFTIDGPSFFVRCCEHECSDRMESLVAYSCVQAKAIASASARLKGSFRRSEIGALELCAMESQPVDQSLERLCSTDGSFDEHISKLRPAQQ